MAHTKQGKRTDAYPQGDGKRPVNRRGSEHGPATRRASPGASASARPTRPTGRAGATEGHQEEMTARQPGAGAAAPGETSTTNVPNGASGMEHETPAPPVTPETSSQAQPNGTSPQRAPTAPHATHPPSGATPPASAAERPVVSSVRQRAGTPRPTSRPRPAQRQSWWRRNLTLLITVGVVVVIVAGFIGIAIGNSNSNQSGSERAAASPQVFQQVTNVPASVFDAVGTGGLKNPLTALPAGPALTQSGKPEVLYIGAEYCPFCAAERWSLVVALSRFGTWHTLNTTTSSSTDVYPNTPTFTFVGSGYTSGTLAFVPREIQDRQGNNLETLTPQEQAILNTYDAPPYVPRQSAGGIPFASYGNQFMTLSSGYSPQLLHGLSWEQIAGKLSDPNDPVTKGIVGNANYLTAAICKITNNQPDNVCGSQTIQQITAQLPTG